MKRSLVQHPGGDQDRLVEYLEDKLFGHFPRKLRSAKVAVRGCLLVNRPLQVQIPKKNTRDETSQVRKDCEDFDQNYLKP